MAYFFLVPLVGTALNTVSTDDAYVNSHVTFVAARVPGQVLEVLVDDNYRVKQGDILVRLDREPYEVQVAIKKSALIAAEQDVIAAKAQATGLEGQARSQRWQTQLAVEQVRNQIALLKAKVEAYKAKQAVLERAKADLIQGKDLLASKNISREDYDLRVENSKVADAQVKQALEDVYQTRASLGLPAVPADANLTEVPPDLDQTYSSVRTSLAGLAQTMAQLGLDLFKSDATPDEVLENFRKRDVNGDIDSILKGLIPNVPAVKQAEAKRIQAKADLDQAELNLRYCDVVADIDGVVTRRNVNPGNNVQAGQSLMAVRSLTEIWIDANFKETQLANLRIGQHVRLEVDMYGSGHQFDGRITGFTMGTGSTLALLPPENATGNFIKVVQRLPVRIELNDYDPDKFPLFNGTSVQPYVYYKEPLIGNDPGKGNFLHREMVLPQLGAAHQAERRQAVSTAAISAPAARRAINPWIIAAAVVVPTFMEVLDTTIANVALRYIAGGLSAAVVDSEWVITSYLAANAFILPISGWLSNHFGRRNYFLMSIAVFTISSGLCGMATSLNQLIACRILQGLAGGGLQPSSQGVLLDSFPREKQGAAMTLFGVAALLAPVVGPVLGGYITDNYNWRWIFYINLPVGAFAFLACYALLDDPDYLKKERAELKKRPFRFDYIGLGLLALVMSSWEITLSKGQEWDWLGDPFWRVQTLVAVFVVGLGCLLVREMRIANPIVDFRPLRERNFAVSCIIISSVFAVLYASTTTLPALLQSLFGYDAYHSGLVMAPAGVFSIIMMLIVGFLLGRGTDARWLILSGLLVAGAASYWMSQMNLEISPWQVVWPRVTLIVGLSLIFAPISVAAYMYVPRELRGAAVGLFSLLRNEGGSVGTSLAQTMEERREQFHDLRLGEHLDPLTPTTNSFMERATAFFMQQTGDPVGSRQQALQALANLRDQQAVSLAYFDVFWLCGVLAFGLAFLVLLMKRSVAEKGAHVAAE